MIISAKTDRKMMFIKDHQYQQQHQNETPNEQLTKKNIIPKTKLSASRSIEDKLNVIFTTINQPTLVPSTSTIVTHFTKVVHICSWEQALK